MVQLDDEGPRYLYKYKRIDEDHLDYSSRIFTHNELYFSKVGDFNDPFDCRYRYELNGSEADLAEYHDRVQREHHPSCNEQERRSETAQWLAMKWGIYCLSAVPDDILMWAHYADGHRGFCLQFLNDPSDYFYVKRKSNDPDFLYHPFPITHGGQVF